MPLKKYKCTYCECVRESFKAKVMCNHNQEEEGVPVPLQEMEPVYTAPKSKFMEPRDKEKNRSVLKNQENLLKERAKEHARLNDYHDFVQEQGTNAGKRQGWLREDGTVRKKVDES